MDKITVTQDDVEAAKDEGATFVLEELAEMVGVSDWSIQDGSESWEGDVSATAYHILVQAKVINDWDNSVARHQTDAQMAAPDALAAELAALDAKATPGPWRVGSQLGEPYPHLIDMGAPPKAPFVCFYKGKRTDNLTFNTKAVAHTDGPADERDASVRLIVTLRNNLPAILKALGGSNAD